VTGHIQSSLSCNFVCVCATDQWLSVLESGEQALSSHLLLVGIRARFEPFQYRLGYLNPVTFRSHSSWQAEYLCSRWCHRQQTLVVDAPGSPPRLPCISEVKSQKRKKLLRGKDVGWNSDRSHSWKREAKSVKKRLFRKMMGMVWNMEKSGLPDWFFRGPSHNIPGDWENERKLLSEKKLSWPWFLIEEVKGHCSAGWRGCVARWFPVVDVCFSVFWVKTRGSLSLPVVTWVKRVRKAKSAPGFPVRLPTWRQIGFCPISLFFE